MIPVNLDVYKSKQVLSEEELFVKLQDLKSTGKIIGWVTGSFDLMHPGHIAHINAAQKKCDILIVSIASDKYNQQIRNKNGRPIFTAEVRAFMVAQLKAVDFVVINEDSCHLIRKFKPDVYFKGIDYKGLNIPEIAVAAEVGTKMCYTDTEKLSTTELIKYIKEEIG